MEDLIILINENENLEDAINNFYTIEQKAPVKVVKRRSRITKPKPKPILVPI